jgi:hypothetical protein
MQKFNSYVFMTICEINLLKFKQSDFLTFTSFHNHYKFLLKDVLDNKLSITDSTKLHDLIDIILIDLNQIFALDVNESFLLILEYYDLDIEKILEMRRLSVLLNECFNFTGC